MRIFSGLYTKYVVSRITLYSLSSASSPSAQAVLESKWPSTNQGGRLRWAKLRNVLMAVAQFRQPIRQQQKCGSIGSRTGQDCWSMSQFVV